MELRQIIRLTLLTLLGIAPVTPASGAAFNLGIATAPAIVTTNRTLVYTMVLTNVSGFVLSDVIVSSTFNSRINFLSANNSAGTAGLDGSAIVFRTTTLNIAGTVTLSLNLRPDVPGLLTNSIQMGSATTANEFTNTVNRVYVAEANLGVTMQSPTYPVVAGDWVNYRLTVTNAGPELVPLSVITNWLPANAQFISLTPSNPPVNIAAHELNFRASTLPPGQTSVFNLVMQPNTATLAQLSAHILGVDVFDPVPANNSTTNTLQVELPTAGVLSASFVPPARFNPQTGLMEQVIRITNIDDTAIAMSRIVLSGLNFPVLNASGTNSGLPFIVLQRRLAPGESADLTLDYFSATRTPAPGFVLNAFQVPLVVPSAQVGEEVAINRILRLANGSALLEFTTVPGAAYSVIYGAQVPLTNGVPSLPTLYAPADKTQWIDNGPPRTPVPPDEVPTRFYRVIRAQ